MLSPPFSFAKIWKEVYDDMPEATYDNVKNQVFKYVEEGDLEQQFDEQRREIVFVPRA